MYLFFRLPMRDDFVRLRERVEHREEGLWQSALERLLSAEFITHSQWLSFVRACTELLRTNVDALRWFAVGLHAAAPTAAHHMEMEALFVSAFEQMELHQQNIIRAHVLALCR